MANKTNTQRVTGQRCPYCVCENFNQKWTSAKFPVYSKADFITHCSLQHHTTRKVARELYEYRKPAWMEKFDRRLKKRPLTWAV